MLFERGERGMEAVIINVIPAGTTRRRRSWSATWGSMSGCSRTTSCSANLRSRFDATKVFKGEQLQLHAREMEHWSAQLAAERDASRDREAHVQLAADEARSALEHDSSESSCLIQATWA